MFMMLPGMKFMYITAFPSLGTVVEPRFTHTTVSVDEPVQPDSHHVSKMVLSGELTELPEVNSTLLHKPFIPL